MLICYKIPDNTQMWLYNVTPVTSDYSWDTIYAGTRLFK